VKAFPIKNNGPFRLGQCYQTKYPKIYGSVGLTWGHHKFPNFHGSAGQTFGGILANRSEFFELGKRSKWLFRKRTFAEKLIVYSKSAIRDSYQKIIHHWLKLLSTELTSGEALYQSDKVAKDFLWCVTLALNAVIGRNWVDHGCEYMTGALVISLGEIGKKLRSRNGGELPLRLERLHQPRSILTCRCRILGWKEISNTIKTYLSGNVKLTPIGTWYHS